MSDGSFFGTAIHVEKLPLDGPFSDSKRLYLCNFRRRSAGKISLAYRKNRGRKLTYLAVSKYLTMHQQSNITC